MITVNKGHYDDKAGEEYDLDLLEAAREAAGLAAERSIQVNHLEELSWELYRTGGRGQIQQR